MQKDTFWDASNDSCSIGNSRISRVVDLEHVPFAAELVFPDANSETIKQLSKKIGLQHFSDVTLDLLLSFHSFLISRKVPIE